MGDVVTLFEIPVDDVESARRFYAAAFGWKAVEGMRGAGTVPQAVAGREEPVPRVFTEVLSSDVNEQGLQVEPGSIFGILTNRVEDVRSPTFFISVENIDASMECVISNGGSVAVPKTSAGDVGSYAYFRDPFGNVIGLWQDTIIGIRRAIQDFI